ncbi:MAG: hypothetical protein ACU826_05245 [Gammaproteobacteria bacterium]
MTIFKKSIAIMLFILPLGLFNNVSWAEEVEAAAPAATVTAGDVINHLNKAIPWLENGDVANATRHIKLAREAIAGIEGDSPELKSAKNSLVSALVHSKKGHPQQSIEAINKAIASLHAL